MLIGQLEIIVLDKIIVVLQQSQVGASVAGSRAGVRSTARGDRLAPGLAWVCLALAALLPLLTFWGLARDWPSALLAALGAVAPGRPAPQPAAPRLLAAVALGLAPVLLMSLGLVRAARCLRGFAAPEPLTPRAVRELRACAGAVFAAGLAGLALPTLSVWLLTAGDPRGGVLTLALSSHQLFLLLFAGVTWCIAGVLARAVALAEENAQFV